ncbi:dodecin domain-containing protein [Acetobacter sacchari]|uniref:Dodecin domain-containing protein n=1 Tax=Acetobacter sacchari TaxID=2661687 RepID=A0ABS3LTY4_9PROT|nr:dodecin [Acetobacter sacchari]MBO1359370.1 dodecin domain-containing protein [Acetobacter sacchari]
MSDHVYRVVEVVGSSGKSVEAAIENAVSTLAKDEKHLRWFEVTSTRGHIEHGKVSHYQVTLKIGLTLDDK